MKKIIALLFVLPLLLGLTIYRGQSFTAAWDAAENATSYQLLLSVDKANITVLGETAATELAFIVEQEGNYLLGVRSVREVAGERLYSEITWSDGSGALVPFALRWYEAPGAPGGLRIK